MMPHPSLRSRQVASVLLVFAVAALIGLSLRNGWLAPADPQTAKDADQPKSKEKEKPKPDFDRPRLIVQPGNPLTVEPYVKPGHWTSATLEMKANNFNFVGQLDSEILNAAGEPIELERAPFRLTSSRPAALTKDQKKYLEMTLFVPAREEQPQLGLRLRHRGGDMMSMPPEPLQRMPSYQYFFFVMARNPERYAYLKQLDSIRPPADDTIFYYRVVAPQIDRRVSLPSNPLAWTATAFMLWDDVHPELLEPEQRQALVDWLHWGGQLIVSGPDTLDALKGSFLEPYLPATSAATTTLGAEQLQSLNARWTLDDNIAGKRRPGRALTVKQPWVAVKLAPVSEAQFVPDTGDLLVERRVGRGRVLVSAFRLHERDLLSWSGFDGFFNACVLRHPPREFREGKLADVNVSWSGDERDREADPTLLTGLRYLARDSGFVFQPSLEPTFDGRSYERTADGPLVAIDPPSLGMWSDFNPVSVAARSSLREAAGIEIPKPEFVVWAVALYLAVLVPVNWAVFRLLGHVEWAWFAAPVIALAGTVVVTKMARLDIGFTRSQREIALVELHAGYPRGHIARFTALYTSLSTTYDVHFDDPSALAQPFSADVDRIRGQSIETVDFRRDEDTALAGYPVSSNSTGMVHSEHMFDAGGAMTLAGRESEPRVVNGTRMALAGAAVIRRLGDDRIEMAVVGDLAAGESQDLRFSPVQPAALMEYWGKSLAETAPEHPEAASLRQMFELLTTTRHLAIGDAQLVAWTTDEIAGVRVDPGAAQHRQATLVVAHLSYAPLPAPRRDANTRASVPKAELPAFQLFEPQQPVGPPAP